MAEAQTIELDGWVMRVRTPAGSAPSEGENCPVILMLHGWTGDETSMSIFVPALPEDHLLIAPRGTYPTEPRGYSWRRYQAGTWPDLESFSGSLPALLGLLSPDNFPHADFSRLTVMGFSQGTALAYALALSHPQRVSALVGLAGFIPAGVEPLAAGRPLQGKRAFVAHGTQDSMVPIERARYAVQLLHEAGADVTYCEHDVGHKLGAECFRGMKAFFSE